MRARGVAPLARWGYNFDCTLNLFRFAFLGNIESGLIALLMLVITCVYISLSIYLGSFLDLSSHVIDMKKSPLLRKQKRAFFMRQKTKALLTLQ